MARHPHTASASRRTQEGDSAAAKSAVHRNPPKDAANQDEYYEPSLLAVWWEQSPSWFVSMGVHFALLLLLALFVISSKQAADHTVVALPVEIPPIQEPEDTNIDIPKTELPSVEKPVDAKIDEPVDSEDSPPDVRDFKDPKLAAPTTEFIKDIAFTPIPIGDSARTGNSPTGLGNDRIGAGPGTGMRRNRFPPPTLKRTDLALDWFVTHQNRDGSWSFNHTPGDACSGFPSPGSKTSKMGATGLALMTFLGRGFTHDNTTPRRKEHLKYKKAVRRGISYLIKRMKVSGDAGRLFEANGESHSHMYCHGIAACALVEAYGLTKDPELRGPAQYSLNYIVNAQHADGGWRYLPGEPGDTSVLGWQLMAFKSGKLSYLNVPNHVYPQAAKFLDSVQQNGGAEYGYLPSGGHGATLSTSSIGLLCRVYLGWEQDHPGIQRGAELLSAAGPHRTNMYYNYYATMFMYQFGGPHNPTWTKWHKEMIPYLLETQDQKGGVHRRGSWHFAGDGLENGMSDTGGRLYNTALAAMTLQSCYRYERVYEEKKFNTKPWIVDGPDSALAMQLHE